MHEKQRHIVAADTNTRFYMHALHRRHPGNLEFHEIGYNDLWSHSVELVSGVTVAHKYSATGLALLYHFIIEALAAVSEAADRSSAHHVVAARDVGLPCSLDRRAPRSTG